MIYEIIGKFVISTLLFFIGLALSLFVILVIGFLLCYINEKLNLSENISDIFFKIGLFMFCIYFILRIYFVL